MPWVWEIHAIWADSTFNSLITLPSLSRQLVLAISTGLANLMTLPRKNWAKTFYNLPHLAFVTLPFHHQISQMGCTFGKTPRNKHVTRRLSAWQRRSLVISRGLGLAPSRSMACSPTSLESPQFDVEFGTAWEMNLQNYLQHKAKLANLICTRIFHGRCFGMVADCWDGSFLLGGDSWGEQWDNSMPQDVFTLKTGGWLFKRVTSIRCNPTSIQIEPFR